MSRLRLLHRTSALLLAAYALVHLANHLAALESVASHIAFMEALRRLTRIPALEGLLLASVVIQVVSGLTLVWRRRTAPATPFSRLQAASGVWLAFFLIVHVGSVLAARIDGLDTNLHFAAAGLHVAPLYLFFWPYYVLAVAALGVHLGAALPAVLRLRGGTAARLRWACAGGGAGFAVAGAILAAFGGLLYPVEIPASYVANLPVFGP